MPYADAHNHLQKFPADIREQIISRSLQNGVELMFANSATPEDFLIIFQLAQKHKNIIPCFGLHPWFAGQGQNNWMDALERYLQQTPSCAGEIGLDGACAVNMKIQEEVFIRQLKLAKQLDRPAVIHCVKAWGRLLEILKNIRLKVFMLHSYGGSPELVLELAKLGGYFSFGGEISTREKLKTALKTAPKDRILFETESPGKREWNKTPSQISLVVEFAAEITGVDTAELAQLSFNNAKKFLE